MNVQRIMNKGFSCRLKRNTLKVQIKSNNISQHLLHSLACGSLMKYMMPRLCNCRYFISQSIPLFFIIFISYLLLLGPYSQLQTKGDTKMEISFILCAIYLLLGMALIAMCFNLMQVSLHNILLRFRKGDYKQSLRQQYDFFAICEFFTTQLGDELECRDIFF